MSPSQTQPVAQGTLASTPFAHLILYVYQRRSSGTLVVQPQGAAAKSRTGEGEDSVAVLFHRGRAVAARVHASSETLDQALLPLCAWRDGKYEFFEEDLVGSGPTIVTGMFDPYAFVTDAARHHARDQVIDQVLSRFEETPLCVQPGMDLERLMLRPQELHFAEVLRDGTATIDALLSANQLPEPAARRLLYALLVTKVVGPFAPSAEETRSGSPQATSGVPSGLPKGASSGAPSRSQLTHEQRRRQSGAAWAAIAARASQASRPLSGPIDSGSVSDRSLTPAPRGAVPSPVPGRKTPPAPSAPLTAPLRSVTPSGSFRVSRTPIPRETPSPPPGRVTSDPPLEAPPPASGTPRREATPNRPISRVTPRAGSEPVESLDAAGRVRRVEQMCVRGAFDEALPIIRALVETDRRNPVYLGLLASVMFGQGTEGTISKDIVEAVNQALRIHPDEVNALYTKARCYKRMGKIREALHYFRRTVAVAPEHLDAAREVRLLVLRQNEGGKGKR